MKPPDKLIFVGTICFCYVFIGHFSKLVKFVFFFSPVKQIYFWLERWYDREQKFQVVFSLPSLPLTLPTFYFVGRRSSDCFPPHWFFYSESWLWQQRMDADAQPAVRAGGKHLADACLQAWVCLRERACGHQPVYQWVRSRPVKSESPRRHRGSSSSTTQQNRGCEVNVVMWLKRGAAGFWWPPEDQHRPHGHMRPRRATSMSSESYKTCHR